MKTYTQFITEAKRIKSSMLKNAIHKKTREIYQSIHPDLPGEGNHHFTSAVDHISDRMADHFSGASHGPNLNNADVRSEVQNALKMYAHDDRAESRANDKKRDRAYARAMAPKKDKPVKEIKSITKKPRRGIGSY